jgi:hypothetical protein
VKIQIIVRSADWLNSAGTRIRYARLTREIKALGWQLAIDPIGSFGGELALNADIYLFSKCQDAGALMLAEMLREAGALVGFDLFDDYIGGQESLTLMHRAFHRQLIGNLDFLLCSTERMADVARVYDPLVPLHVMNDPHEGGALSNLPRSLASRRALAETNRAIDIVWFGNGNNPLFPVGLEDVVAFGAELGELCQAGWQVRLKVLSNPDALDVAVLGELQTLPVQVSVEPWSEAGEVAALQQALVAFLPVNFQHFSTAKSLNRAVSALVRGAQVFSPGFALYRALDPFIYRSARELADDLAGNRLKLDEASIEALGQRLATIADPAHEARALVHFLDSLPILQGCSPEERAMRGIIHGANSPSSLHRLCTSLGWLSLGSPLSRFHQPYHAEIGQFEPEGELELRVSREGHARLADEWRERAAPLGSKAKGYSHQVPLPDSPAGRTLTAANPSMWGTRAARIVTGPSVMGATEAVYREIFPQTRFLVSDLEMRPIMPKLGAELPQ